MGLAHVITTVVKSITGMFQMVDLHDFREISATDINRLKVSTSSTNIILTPGNQENFTVELKGKVSKRLEHSLTLDAVPNNDTLNVMVSKWRRSNIVVFGFIVNYSKVIVTVPKKWYESIDAHATSGSVEGEGLKADILSFNASSGSVVAKRLEAKTEMMIEASSGSVRASHLESSGGMSIQTSSGSVRANDVNSEKLWIKANSGSIDVSNLTAQEVSIRSSSGSITARDIEGEVKAEASSGSMRIVNDDIKGEWSLKTSSGSTNVRLDHPESLKVKFKGNSGSGRVAIEDFNYLTKMDSSFTGQIGTGENTLNVRTSSGSFHLS